MKTLIQKRSISGTIQKPPLTHEFLNTSASHRWLNVEQVNDTVLVDICFRLVVTASVERLDIEQIPVSAVPRTGSQGIHERTHIIEIV
jgi:hypothetical protein